MTRPADALSTPPAVAPPVAGAPTPVIHTLPSGLELIVLEDRSAPVVSAQAWCRAGSIDEGRWLGAGLSHVLEHMLFKGTATRPGSRLDQEVQEAGGHMNAYTSFDRTVYWINVPDTGARVAVDILCDIVQHAALPADELAKELDVIRREMDMGQDDPGRRSGRRLFETAYTRSPYRYPIIGLPDIFNTLTRDDIAGYYREKYAPNNLFLVVVGDVDAAAVRAQVEAAFAGAKARPLPAAPLVPEPRQTAPREVVEEGPFELGHLHAAWHIPDLRHPDIPALDVLSVVLGSGRSSRLHREVREKAGLVHSADAWTYNPGHPGLFGLSAVLDGGRFAEARAALLAEVERLRAGPVAGAELAKAVRQLVVGALGARKTMQGQAQDLGGSWLAAGDLGFSDRYVAAVKQVSAADLQRVARTYLTPENRTLYALLPDGARPAGTVAAVTHGASPVGKFTLASGLRVLVKEDDRLPFVQLRAVFLGGVLAETPADSGIGSLMARTLVKGAGGRTSDEIAAAIESVGGTLEAYAGNNSFGVTAEVLDEDLPLGLDLLADVLRRPAFPAAEVERERAVQLAGLRAQRDQLLQLAGRAMRHGLFGPAGYGLDTLGTEESVARLTRDDLAAHHARLAGPGNGVLAVFGRVRAAALLPELERRFAGWTGNAPAPAPAPPPAPPAGLVTLHEPRDKKQAVLVLGFLAPTMHSPDRFALELLQESLSDLGSRLFLRIREELGLAYYVGAQHFSGLVPGWFSLYAGTEPAQAARVRDEFLREVAALRAEGLTDAELRRAQAKVLGQRKIARQELGQLALTCALDELYGLGFAWSEESDARFAAVTRDEVLAAVRKHLTPDAAVLAVVSPAAP